jgi:iron complex transport system ATP-binding protein
MVSLQLHGLGASYGGRQVLSGIGTPPLLGGQLVALLGPNAAGKSTLFRRIFGLLRGPGEVRVHGATVSRPIAYMPQDNGSRPILSVYDHASVEQALALLGVAHLRGRNVGDLSGGQRQMVGAAQALAQEPQILLMDEPTSALDLSRQIDLLTLLRRLTREQGLLIIIALHDLGHALRFSDAAMVIGQGRLVACGPTSEVVTEDLLRQVFDVEARIEPCSMGRPQLIVEGRARTG